MRSAGRYSGNPLIGVTRPVGALTPSILANRGSCPAPARSSSRGRARAAPACRRPSAGPRPAASASSPRRTPPARSVRPIEPANRTSPLRQVADSPDDAPSCDGRSGTVNITDPSVCPGAWATATSSPARRSRSTARPARRRSTARSRSPAVRTPARAWPAGPASIEASGSFRRYRSSPWMYAGRLAAVSPPQTGRHRIHVVEVAVGEQDGGRTETVLAAYLGQAVLDPDPRVDDEALLPRTGREDVAVRREGRRGEGDRQHPGEPNGSVRRRHRHGIVTRPAHGDLRGLPRLTHCSCRRRSALGSDRRPGGCC